ncbi:MAG: DUF4147 domain-containing protein [Candidatus Heimdallarchaeota archaeon]|nr:DUF4147 domain-containing protein [Candidatus Heimdallarchaeota archaeon]
MKLKITNYSRLTQFPQSKGRKLLLNLFEIGVNAVDPYLSVLKNVEVNQEREQLRINQDLYSIQNRKVWVIGAGKAVGRMAEAIEKIFFKKSLSGIICVPEGLKKEIKTTKVKVYESTHPLPSSINVQNTKKIFEMLKQVKSEDLVIVLISGGGSAIWAAPIPPITISEFVELNKLLIHSGMTIQEINTVRKHVSLIKGGKLARRIPCETITFVLSDVIGDSLENIASGPVSPDSTTFTETKNILKKYDLWFDAIPESIKTIIRKGANGQIEETPKPTDDIFRNKKGYIVGSNKIACDAIINECNKRQIDNLFLTDKIEGDARWIGKIFARIAIGLIKGKSNPFLIISGGEPTMMIKGTGKGGRNQEVAVAFLQELSKIDYTSDITFLSAGTDGIDGNSPYAGAIIDRNILEALLTRKLNIQQYQEMNNTSSLLSELDESLIETGPTGTNVMDIHLIILNSDQIENNKL